MKNKRMIHLINKEIDKSISLKEKKELESLISSDPEGELFYKDMLAAEAMLDKLPETTPSENLKKNILNSIDYNLYESGSKKSGLNGISSILAGTRKKIAASFALGLAAGAAILFLIFSPSINQTSTETETIYGTVGIAETELIESIPIRRENISGKIELKKGMNFHAFYFDVKSSKQYQVILFFDPEKVTAENFSLKGRGNAKIEKGNGFVKINNISLSQYSLIVSSANMSDEKIELKLAEDGYILFERSFNLSKNFKFD